MMTPSTPFMPFRPFITSSKTPAVAFVPPLPLPIESPAVALAKKAGQGDVLAMRALLREIGPRIQRVVRAVLGRSNEDADDVIQQAMMGFVQSLPSFRGECEPAHFASRVAARTAIACARRRRTLQARHEDGVDLDTLARDSGFAPEPQATAERSKRMELLREVLAQIPAEQAETLSLRIVLGWSLAEVAETMGVPLNTVRSRLRLAKTAMRNVIESNPSFASALADDE